MGPSERDVRVVRAKDRRGVGAIREGRQYKRYVKR